MDGTWWYAYVVEGGRVLYLASYDTGALVWSATMPPLLRSSEDALRRELMGAPAPGPRLFVASLRGVA